MKTLNIINFIAIIISLVSCESEDARTPLGITVSAADFTSEIEENPEENTILGTLTAFASDNSTINFIIDSETPEGALTIDRNTGEISVLDASYFEFDEYTEINAVVNAMSGKVTSAIAINIQLIEILDIESDRDALIDIYNDNTDENGDNTLTWDITETDISAWEGVTVTDNRLTVLNISNKQINSIPNSIYKISEATTLDLSNNTLETLNESIAQLENLTALNISGNSIVGELPEVICSAFTFDQVSFIKDETTTCPDTVTTEDE